MSCGAFTKRRSDCGGGRKDAPFRDSLLASSPFEAKSLTASVVCSAKRKRHGHRKRDEFVATLERSGIPGLDIFGRGRARQAACKRDAILPYRYHIVLENSAHPDYWTEKLADAYLGGAFPFYWGCPNIDRYFPEGSFARIDIGNPGEALRTIRDTIGAGTFERALPLLDEARNLVLDRYNLFPTVVSLFRKFPSAPGTERVPVTLRPERDFTLKGRIRRFWSGLTDVLH